MPDESEVQDSEQPSSRPFWSGTITFGLVTVPVNLFPANRGNRVALHMYGPSGVRLKRRYFSPDSGADLSAENIVRGFEHEKNNFVVVTDDELERVAPEKSRDIDLRRFVPYADIPKLYFERGYFLAPAGGSPRAYRLLAETMERRGRAGIATFVMRGKEYLVAIVADSGLLRAETLRFADEVRSPEDLGLPPKAKVPAQAVTQFEQIIRKHSVGELRRDLLKNAESQRLLDLIKRKQAKGNDVVRGKGKKGNDEVVDLLQVLRQALAAQGNAARKDRTDGDSADTELAGLSKDELYKRATRLKIAGRSSMTKEQLVVAIQNAAA